jgi:hypothetical protein
MSIDMVELGESVRQHLRVLRGGIDCNASKQPISNVVLPNKINEYRHG